MFGSKNRRIADLQARVQQLIEERDEAREDAADFKSAAVRTAGRNTVLAKAEAAHDADLDHMADRIDRVLRACARYRAAHAAERRRADRLQHRLDDALGLNHPAITDGRNWQHTRQDKQVKL